MTSPADAMPIGSTAEYGIWRVILASSVGTMIEWYDFYIFGSLAAVLSVKFYPPGNDTFAYIAYLATFAVGFLVRPFGALFFGRIGDLVGRKYAFLVTLTIMGGATFLIGLLPVYSTAGWFSPITLILIRVLQGLALGGDDVGSAAEGCLRKMGESQARPYFTFRRHGGSGRSLVHRPVLCAFLLANDPQGEHQDRQHHHRYRSTACYAVLHSFRRHLRQD